MLRSIFNKLEFGVNLRASICSCLVNVLNVIKKSASYTFNEKKKTIKNHMTSLILLSVILLSLVVCLFFYIVNIYYKSVNYSAVRYAFSNDIACPGSNKGECELVVDVHLAAPVILDHYSKRNSCFFSKFGWVCRTTMATKCAQSIHTRCDSRLACFGTKYNVRWTFIGYCGQ